MRGSEYRERIRKIVRGATRQALPGAKPATIKELSDLIARNVHANLYGACVDDVASPLWRETSNGSVDPDYRDKQPNRTARDILDDVSA
jgi:hypothetical protein